MLEPKSENDLQNQSQNEQEELVAHWLLSTPGFFDRHPQLLLSLDLGSSLDGRVLSLQEKQMNVLRSQNRDLNQRTTEMLRFGMENDLTQNLMVQWLEDLCSKKTKVDVIENITIGLNNMFKVGRVEYIPPSEIDEIILETLNKEIIVGTLPAEINFPSLNITEEEGSFALVPLNIHEKKLGAILFVSKDISKYTLDTGLVYLQQLGRLAAAALSRFEED
jgi:uncharacterized protein YigA (DUF484 family)